jgi:hypothetical protein
MDEKMKVDDKKVLFVAGDEEAGKLKAVTGLSKSGKVKSVNPTAKNAGNFLEIDKNGNALENFFKKFLEQAQRPSHTGFFLVAKNLLDKVIVLPLDSEELKPYRIDPVEYLAAKEQQSQKPDEKKEEAVSQTTAFQPFDESRIDRSRLERLGVKWEDLEPNLKAMLYGHKSPQLIPMNPVIEGMEVPTKGRLSLEETPDGSLRFVPHYVQDKLNLDVPFQGILLSEQDKEQLLKTGNAGRVVELEPVSGQKIPAFVAVDKLTNRLEALPLDKVNIPQTIKGVDLTAQQRSALGEGKKALVEGMTSRNGIKFDAYLQINASRKAFDFSYEGLDRNRYRQDTKQQEGQVQDRQTVRIPQKLLGVELTPGQQDMLRDNKVVYIKAMVKDGQDQPFNAYVKINHEKGKLDFFKWNPDRARKQGAEVIPVNESKTQVAVNTHGKTNEATKNVKEPLKQGQTQPAEEQQRTKKPVVKKSTGHKV